MVAIAPSQVIQGHPDYDILVEIAREMEARIGRHPGEAFSDLIIDAIEFVLDPIRTGRTRIGELDNVEKTFIGLKTEHFLRDLLDCPKGIRDLRLGGHDVDVKNTVSQPWSWMIPPETYRAEEPVVLIASDDETRASWMGLLVARDAYLGKPNRDGKRGILVPAYPNILWLARSVAWPPNRWEGLDMARFRDLRRIKGGKVRAAAFFSENVGRITHRSVVVALLFDQDDPMKRLRANGGARDILGPGGIALLSGRYDAVLAASLGYTLGQDDHVAVAATSKSQELVLRRAGKIT